MSAVVRMAKQEDAPVIVRLLEKADLDARGVGEHLSHFLILEDRTTEETQIVGTVGIELYGEKALLRSLVLDVDRSSVHKGLELLRVVLAYVDHLQVDELYLMTRMPPPFFEQLGFSKTGWDALPEEIYTSPHVQYTDRQAAPMVRYAKTAQTT